ncbi:MAG: hypothetical protein GPJ54_22200 [Candidatus Heimdallarchaeota archaeon]|nr:hypothetical protein [Candidatus Heimdallarchaeota archaeon]
MKKIKLIFIFIVLLGTTNIVNVQSQVIGDIVTITPDEGFELEGQASGKLVWPEGKRQVVELNLTKTLLPTNISRIYVDVITFDIIGNIEGIDAQVDTASTTPEFILSETNQTAYLNQTLFPPDLADQFFINITMLVGTSFNRQVRLHVIRFPDEGTILVDRDKLVPLVNLYGFPPSSFFSKFLPLYAIIVTVLLIPGFYYSISKLLRSSRKAKSSIIDEEENNND